MAEKIVISSRYIASLLDADGDSYVVLSILLCLQRQDSNKIQVFFLGLSLSELRTETRNLWLKLMAQII